MALYRLPGVPFYNLPRVNRWADRVFRREIEDVLLYYSDNELHRRYCFSRQTIRYITRLVEDEIAPITNRSEPVSAINQVLITLRYLASGSFQQVTGDTFVSLDKSTVCRVIRRVTVALSRKVDQFIKFPQSQEERDSVKQGLYEIANFPCAIGIIDASHIRIIAPTENEWDFVNRKRYHSVNVQGICDHKGMLSIIVQKHLYKHISSLALHFFCEDCDHTVMLLCVAMLLYDQGGIWVGYGRGGSVVNNNKYYKLVYLQKCQI